MSLATTLKKFFRLMIMHVFSSLFRIFSTCGSIYHYYLVVSILLFTYYKLGLEKNPSSNLSSPTHHCFGAMVQSGDDLCLPSGVERFFHVSLMFQRCHLDGDGAVEKFSGENPILVTFR
jgi:hypothetical protein